MSPIRLTRRELLEAAGVAAASALVAGCERHVAGAALRRKSAGSAGDEVSVVLRAVRGRAALGAAAGPEADVWRFEGRLLAGPSDALAPGPGSGSSYLGPTLRVRPGQRLRVRFENRIGEPSIVHWHGLDVSEDNDGHPRQAVPDGGAYDYDFRVTDRPGTYWYHPHPHRRTGAQVYGGLAGMLLVVDDDDEARGLPAADHDLALVLQDRLLDPGGQLVYAPDPMAGMLGPSIFVNGRPSPTLTVESATYRLRLLNGSNSRIYKVAFADRRPLTVVGSDGGLLARPIEKPYVVLAPGERVELWADFGRQAQADEIALSSRSFDGGPAGMMGMMGMMGGGGRSGGRAPPNGSPMPLCRFRIEGRGPRLTLPARLRAVDWRPPGEVVNLASPRRFQVSMMHMQGLLNGRVFEMDDVAPDERIRLGDTEDWEIVNAGGMPAMPHPIHVHGGQFQIVERAVAEWGRAAVDGVAEGRVDEGWKDTVLLMPGERARIRVRFARHAGTFLYHCHNLEHEDGGMMRNFVVDG